MISKTFCFAECLSSIPSAEQRGMNYTRWLQSASLRNWGVASSSLAVGIMMVGVVVVGLAGLADKEKSLTSRINNSKLIVTHFNCASPLNKRFA